MECAEEDLCLGISRSKMTSLRNSRLGKFSVDLLFSLLEKLDRHTDNIGITHVVKK